MLTFTTQRNAARHGADVTDRTWTVEAVADGVVVADYTLAPVTWTGLAGTRWLTMRGTDLDVVENIVAASLATLEAAHDAAEDDARGRHHGRRDAEAGKAMPDPEHLDAMGAYFGSAYREAYAEAERAGA